MTRGVASRARRVLIDLAEIPRVSGGGGSSAAAGAFVSFSIDASAALGLIAAVARAKGHEDDVEFFGHTLEQAIVEAEGWLAARTADNWSREGAEAMRYSLPRWVRR